MYTKYCKECGVEFQTNRKPREYCSKTCSNKVIAINREKAKEENKVFAVWSCGGGVQSTCIAVLIEQGKLPKPDLSIMIDTGYEKESTMNYVKGVTIPRLAKVGVTLNIVKTTDYYDNDLFDRQGHLVLPAFKLLDGRTIKYNTHCNNKWKQKVTKKWLRGKGVERAEGWIGISSEESDRQHIAETKWYTNRYPLIELGISREDCLSIIEKAGWSRPPRTSCYMCPLQADAEWKKMREEEPEDFEQACRLDEYLRTKEKDVYIYRKLIPLRKVEFK